MSPQRLPPLDSSVVALIRSPLRVLIDSFSLQAPRSSLVALTAQMGTQHDFGPEDLDGEHGLLHEVLLSMCSRPGDSNSWGDVVRDGASGHAVDREWLAERLLGVGCKPWTQVPFQTVMGRPRVDALDLALVSSSWRLAEALMGREDAPPARELAKRTMYTKGDVTAGVWLCLQSDPACAALRHRLGPHVDWLDVLSEQAKLASPAALAQLIRHEWWPSSEAAERMVRDIHDEYLAEKPDQFRYRKTLTDPVVMAQDLATLESWLLGLHIPVGTTPGTGRPRL